MMPRHFPLFIPGFCQSLSSEKNPDSLDFKLKEKIIDNSENLFSKLPDAIKNRSIQDILVTGPLLTPEYNKYSPLFVFILINLNEIDENSSFQIKKIQYNWNIDNQTKHRGFNSFYFLLDPENFQSSFSSYSLLGNQWIKKPSICSDFSDSVECDSMASFISDLIEKMETRMESSIDKGTIQGFGEKLKRIKRILQSLRRDTNNNKPGVGNHCYQKLKKEGYIDKLVDLIIKSGNKFFI
jgi:hypothetical protein